MPDRATIEAATPKCPATVDVALHDAAPGQKVDIVVGARQCGEPMAYSDTGDGDPCWVCPVHGPCPAALLVSMRDFAGDLADA